MLKSSKTYLTKFISQISGHSLNSQHQTCYFFFSRICVCFNHLFGLFGMSLNVIFLFFCQHAVFYVLFFLHTFTFCLCRNRIAFSQKPFYIIYTRCDSHSAIRMENGYDCRCFEKLRHNFINDCVILWSTILYQNEGLHLRFLFLRFVFFFSFQLYYSNMKSKNT